MRIENRRTSELNRYGIDVIWSLLLGRDDNEVRTGQVHRHQSGVQVRHDSIFTELFPEREKKSLLIFVFICSNYSQWSALK